MKTKEIQIVAEIGGVMTVISITFGEEVIYIKSPKVSIKCAGTQPIGFIEIKQIKEISACLRDIDEPFTSCFEHSSEDSSS